MLLSNPFDTFTFRSSVQDDEITDIPRRKQPSQNKPKQLKMKFYNQLKCNHSRCLQFEEQFDDEEDFIRWQSKMRQRFHTLNDPAKVQYLASLVTWRKPKRTTQIWLNNDSVKSYPLTYEIRVHAVNGLGSYLICRNYFKHLFSIGVSKFTSMMQTIWLSRSCGDLMIEHKQNYKGYKNKTEEPQWIKEFVSWAINNKDLSRSHYTKDKDTIYFELDGTEKETWTRLWQQFIEHTQPDSYHNYVANEKDCLVDENIKKPVPSKNHFLKIIPKHLKCKPQRVSQDKCNGCAQLLIFRNEAVTEESKKQVESLQAIHLKRAKYMYQLNTHCKKTAELSFKHQSIKVTNKAKPMQHANTFVHYEFDYDVDRAECVNNLNMTYYKKKITMKSLNMVQHPADEKGERKIYAWSGMVGGKAVEETLQCLDHSFSKSSVGAERCFLNCDGALISYAILQAFAWFVHPKNKKRYFRAINLLSPETGHSRLEADTINKQVNDHYRRKERFAKCKDRVEFINKETNIEMIQWPYFATLPNNLFKRIFKDSSSWKDQFGHSAGIRGDKGMCYEFGQSQVWDNELKQFEWIDHYKELWIRCDEDLKQPCRKILIFNDMIDELSTDYLDTLRKQRTRKEHPIIQRDALNGTLDIAKMFPNRNELIQYYTPSSVDESGEIREHSYKTNHEKIRVKMERR